KQDSQQENDEDEGDQGRKVILVGEVNDAGAEQHDQNQDDRPYFDAAGTFRRARWNVLQIGFAASDGVEPVGGGPRKYAPAVEPTRVVVIGGPHRPLNVD